MNGSDVSLDLLKEVVDRLARELYIEHGLTGCNGFLAGKW